MGQVNVIETFEHDGKLIAKDVSGNLYLVDLDKCVLHEIKLSTKVPVVAGNLIPAQEVNGKLMVDATVLGQ